MRAEIYVEGGGPPGKLTNIRCRAGFRKLLANCGLDDSRFQVTACGGGGDARNDFRDALADAGDQYYVALLIDSESPVANIEETWKHLTEEHNWQRPPDARDDQVLFMTTCMETWIVADRSALYAHFGQCLLVSELPDLDSLEELRRGTVKDRLQDATRSCPAPYGKGPNSFGLLGRLDPTVLEARLPSFRRARRILTDKLV